MKLRTSDSRPGLWYVNLYHTDIAYGGPEEGGWWYDYGRYQRTHTFFFVDEESAYERARILNERTNAIQRDIWGCRPKHSVLGDGWLEWHVENHRGVDYPDSRPYYE